MLFFSSFTLCLRLYLGSLSLAKFFQVWQSFTSDKTGLFIKIAQKTFPSRTFCFFHRIFSQRTTKRTTKKKRSSLAFQRLLSPNQNVSSSEMEAMAALLKGSMPFFIHSRVLVRLRQQPLTSPVANGVFISFSSFP